MKPEKLDLESIFLAKIRELDPTVGEVILDCGDKALHIQWNDRWDCRVIKLERLSEKTKEVAKKIQEQRERRSEVIEKILKTWVGKFEVVGGV